MKRSLDLGKMASRAETRDAMKGPADSESTIHQLRTDLARALAAKDSANAALLEKTDSNLELQRRLADAERIVQDLQRKQVDGSDGTEADSAAIEQENDLLRNLFDAVRTRLRSAQLARTPAEMRKAIAAINTILLTITTDSSPSATETAPPSLEDASTSARAFRKEMTTAAEGSTLPLTEVYDNYSQWCSGKNVAPVSIEEFQRTFGLQPQKIAGRVRYVNISWKTDAT